MVREARVPFCADTWTSSSLVSAMATYASAHSGFNPTAAGTTMPTDTTLQNAISASWHH
jgi:hypothetical protein